MAIRKHLLRSKASLGALVAFNIIAPAAYAQNSAEEEGVSEGNVIVVTARKSEEGILEVPIAITAFSEEDIAERALETIEDVQLFTPGFTFEKFNTVPGRLDSSPRFRGISVDTLAPTRQTASVFVDGIYVINSASGISLADIERVEVIKGPQSAFFGRNTFGGAVNYVSKTPGFDFGGQVDVSVATRDDYQASGSIEGPIIGDVLSARVSGAYHSDGGHYVNSVDPNQRLGEEETWSVTGSLFFQPSDAFEAKIRVNYFENDDGPAAAVVPGLAFHNCGPFGGPQNDTLICGDVPRVGSVAGNGTVLLPALNADVTQLPANFFTNTAAVNAVGQLRDDFGFDRQSLNFSGQFKVNLTDNLSFSSLTGYSTEEASLIRDGDESATLAFAVVNNREFETFSQEFRFQGSALDDNLNWTLGFNYIDLRFTSAGNFVSPTSGFVFGDLNPNQEDIETFGYFGSLAYTFADVVTLTLEGRYQLDRVQEDDDTTNFVGTSAPNRASFKNFLPRVILDFQASDSTLVYASFSEGNLPGGFNGGLIALSPTELAQVQAIEPNAGFSFDEETLRQYELGVKHGFADGKGSVSAALYYMERTGQAFRRSELITSDANTPLTANFNINAGSTEVKGFEIEGNYQIASFLNVEGNIAYTDAEIQRFESSIHNEIFGVADAAGRKTARFPKWSGSLAATAEFPVSDTMDWFTRVDANYIGERFTDEGNLTTAPDGVLVNLRTGIKVGDLKLEAFVKNLTNSSVPLGVQRNRDLSLGFGGFSIFGYIVGLRDKRQFGARASFKF